VNPKGITAVAKRQHAGGANRQQPVLFRRFTASLRHAANRDLTLLDSRPKNFSCSFSIGIGGRTCHLLGKNPPTMNDRRQPPVRRFTFARNNPERREIERRDSPRFPVAASVRFLRTASDWPEVIDGDVIEASLTGMRVVLDRSVRKNEQLLVEVTSELHGGFNITAQIMWVEETPEELFIAGCEFCSILSLKQRAQLQRLSEMAAAECC
jgi:hypothetical protein